jgi:hypothetical protein
LSQFKRGLWDAGDDIKPQDQLLLAVTIWLRTYSCDDQYLIGLDNLIKILVPFTTELKLGLGVPTLPADRIVSSEGDIWRVVGPGKFVYSSSNWAREFELQGYYDTSIQLSVHRSWLEWAVMNAILNLDHAGKPWLRDNKRSVPTTIGGIELAEFLK